MKMNIFILSLIHSQCAQMHVDKHVVKMILETCQLLCSVHHMTESTYEPPYKLAHKNHPCSIWARESLDNYIWLCKLGIELCKEYTFRYGKTHKSEDYIYKLYVNYPPIKSIGLTNFAQAMPEEYKDKNAVIAYRRYYLNKKRNLFSWKKRNVPYWIF